MAFQDTFKALSDPVRREILTLLRSAEFDMTGATISYHLSILKKAGLVDETKYKNFIYYELCTSVFEELVLWINQFKSSEKNNGDEAGEENGK